MINEILDVNHDQYRIIGKNYTVLHTKTIKGSTEFMTKWFFIALVVLLVLCLMLSTFGMIFHRKNGQSMTIYSLSPSGNFPPVVQQIFGCFSIRENLKGIFEVGETKNDPLKAVIHGIRAFSAIYVILAHIGYFALYIIDNSREALKHTSEIPFIPFVNSAIMIDNFFAMSGFLLGLGVINAEKRSVGSFRIFVEGILCRYLR